MIGAPAPAWIRITGDGVVHEGECIVKSVIMHPDAAGDYADIYDGRDATSGVKFCRMENAVDSTLALNLGDGVLFGRGVFVDGYDSAVETTVTFIPL
jgi:hypothetical protein